MYFIFFLLTILIMTSISVEMVETRETEATRVPDLSSGNDAVARGNGQRSLWDFIKNMKMIDFIEAAFVWDTNRYIIHYGFLTLFCCAIYYATLKFDKVSYICVDFYPLQTRGDDSDSEGHAYCGDVFVFIIFAPIMMIIYHALFLLPNFAIPYIIFNLGNETDPLMHYMHCLSSVSVVVAVASVVHMTDFLILIAFCVLLAYNEILYCLTEKMLSFVTIGWSQRLVDFKRQANDPETDRQKFEDKFKAEVLFVEEASSRILYGQLGVCFLIVTIDLTLCLIVTSYAYPEMLRSSVNKGHYIFFVVFTFAFTRLLLWLARVVHVCQVWHLKNYMILRGAHGKILWMSMSIIFIFTLLQNLQFPGTTHPDSSD